MVAGAVLCTTASKEIGGLIVLAAGVLFVVDYALSFGPTRPARAEPGAAPDPPLKAGSDR